MKGTRPLDNTEIRQVADGFDGIYAVRNRGLFVLGVSTSGRISELLSLKVDDIWQNGAPVTDLLFDRSIVKGGEVSRTVPINADGRDAITALIAWHIDGFGNVELCSLHGKPQTQLTAEPHTRHSKRCLRRRGSTENSPHTPCENRSRNGCMTRPLIFSPSKRC